MSIEIPVNHEVRTIRGALRDRINIQAEPKSLDDIAADKERRGALRGAYLEEVKRKLDEADAKYNQKMEEKRRAAQQQGQGEDEEGDEELEFDDL